MTATTEAIDAAKTGADMEKHRHNIFRLGTPHGGVECS